MVVDRFKSQLGRKLINYSQNGAKTTRYGRSDMKSGLVARLKGATHQIAGVNLVREKPTARQVVILRALPTPQDS